MSGISILHEDIETIDRLIAKVNNIADYDLIARKLNGRLNHVREQKKFDTYKNENVKLDTPSSKEFDGKLGKVIDRGGKRAVVMLESGRRVRVDYLNLIFIDQEVHLPFGKGFLEQLIRKSTVK